MKKANIILIALLFPVMLYAQTEAVRKQQFNVKNGLALEGYDPVSYFEGEPAEGKESLKFTYKGLTYKFATQAHLNLFKASSEKYEPAYGGWCAYAMGNSGEKVKVDPETFKIVDGKLYLFYNFWTTNTLKSWNADEKKLKSAADNNWTKTLAK